MVEGMTLDEFEQVTIDYYVNLQRIKKAETGNNAELDFQLKVYQNKLSSLGIPSEEYEM
ncbi:MAG: hypothetical protein HFG32_12340 [Eubacterium sp.]|jgi:hypothetical protein|nr:hypothetical protein [Eubacterium sp.]